MTLTPSRTSLRPIMIERRAGRAERSRSNIILYVTPTDCDNQRVSQRTIGDSTTTHAEVIARLKVTRSCRGGRLRNQNQGDFLVGTNTSRTIVVTNIQPICRGFLSNHWYCHSERRILRMQELHSKTDDIWFIALRLTQSQSAASPEM